MIRRSKKKTSSKQINVIRKNYVVKAVKTLTKPVKVSFKTKSGERISFTANKVYKKKTTKRRKWKYI